MLKALIIVILLQLAMIFKGAIVALANLDTRAMDFIAQVSSYLCFLYMCKTVCIEGGLPCGQRFWSHNSCSYLMVEVLLSSVAG